MDFAIFKAAVSKRFEFLARHSLFRVNLDADNGQGTIISGRDRIWATYLSAFPAGADPIFRERTEHDCNCCKSFIRAVGNCVAIVDGKLETLWDLKVSDPNYQIVADAMAAFVRNGKVTDIFLHMESTAGRDKTFEQVLGGENITWNHLAVTLPRDTVVDKHDIPSTLNGPRDDHQVLHRSLTEFSVEALDIVRELIAQNSLYRGEEDKYATTEFHKLKTVFDTLLTDQAKDLFVWTKVKGISGAVSRIRNSTIGTLLIDLSAGVELDVAVAKYEDKKSGTKYKRPTALVTKGMIDKAKETLQKLGLVSALERRFAGISDITVDNILFADRSAKALMADSIMDELTPTSNTRPKNLDKVEEVTMNGFITNILPHVKTIEVLLENQHLTNMVSLIAPGDPTSGSLFKWDNRFSWSYNSGVADSIKERVKNAGGSVNGVLCCRLAWEYSDDLDFHMYEPSGGTHISFSNKRQKSICGGMLDVDANGGDGQRPDPCENIFYEDKSRMKEGDYRLTVHNWNRRSAGIGFEAQVEFDGKTFNFSYPRVVADKEEVNIAVINYSKTAGFTIKSDLGQINLSKEFWNLKTQNFHKVNVLMMSPNYWDGQVGVGNKHYFFMLEDCLNDGSARGIFNEFLKDELNPHRKVFEMVGSKINLASTEAQLSGLGFSSTLKSHVVVRVTGAFTRLIKIVF
jgi:hypothetical protein